MVWQRQLAKGVGQKRVPRGGGASGQAHRARRGSAEEGRRIFNDKIIKGANHSSANGRKPLMRLPSFWGMWGNGSSQHCRLSEMVDSLCSKRSGWLSFLFLAKMPNSKKECGGSGCVHRYTAITIRVPLKEFGSWAFSFRVPLCSVIQHFQSVFSGLRVAPNSSVILGAPPLLGLLLSPLS